MKRLKQFALGILGTAFLSVGLFACSNEDTNNLSQDTNELATEFKSKTNEDVAIAQDQPGQNSVKLLFDSNQMKKDLVDEGIFAEVESIDVGEGLFTIIGKNTNTYELVAFQVELLKIGDKYYFPNPNNPDLPNTTFAKHKCTGVNCSSCSFTRKGGSLSKITGCACNDEKEDSKCNHEISGQDVSDSVKDAIDTAIKIIGIFK